MTTQTEAFGYQRGYEAGVRAVREAVRRNAYRDRFPDVPDEQGWPSRESDDALIAGQETEPLWQRRGCSPACTARHVRECPNY